MESYLESLPPEIIANILEMIYRSQTYKRQQLSTFVSLSLTSKTCRSVAMPFLLRRLSFKSLMAKPLTFELQACRQTLVSLGAFGYVKGVDIFVADDAWIHHSELVDFLAVFPNLTHFYINHIMDDEIIDEVHELLKDRCIKGHRTSDRHGWWYERSG